MVNLTILPLKKSVSLKRKFEEADVVDDKFDIIQQDKMARNNPM